MPRLTPLSSMAPATTTPLSTADFTTTESTTPPTPTAAASTTTSTATATSTSVRPRPRLIPLSSTAVSTLPTPMASTTTPTAPFLTPPPTRMAAMPGPTPMAPMATSMVATGDGTRRQTNAWTTDLDYDNDIKGQKLLPRRTSFRRNLH